MFKIIFILLSISSFSSFGSFGSFGIIGAFGAMNQIKQCNDCKWFINKNNGMCKLFTIYNNKPEFNLASDCINNPFLCGSNPWFYSPIEKTVINEDKNFYDIFTQSDIFTQNDIFTQSDIFTQNEMQQIERDFIFFKNKISLKKDEEEAYKKYSENIAKINKKNYKKYSNEKDLYKLFRKK
jgi:hypothetical protein